ncbi:hypothetical protein ACLESO_23995 [Pyxidicoccus sp. 3LG]
MAVRAWSWALMLLLAGCASSRVVRLDTGQGAPQEYVPPTSDRSVEVDEDDFEEALGRLALEVPLSLRPAEAGWLVRASTHGSAMDGALRSALRGDYGRWCHAHEGPGDCLSLLEDGLGFSTTDKLQLSLGLSLDPMHESIADAVENTLNPTFFKAVVVSALVVGKGTVGGATWLASRLPLLPGFGEAAALSASRLGVNLLAIEQVSEVAVVENGVVITLAPNAVAMVALSSGAIQGDPDGTVHHICTDKNTASEKEGGPWTPQWP